MQVSHYYVTPDDGVTRLHVCRILPETEPRFVLQIVHGIAERAERYLPLLSYIASCGGIAVIHDLRGHGIPRRMPACSGTAAICTRRTAPTLTSFTLPYTNILPTER